MAKQQGLSDEHFAGMEARPAGLFTAQEIAALDLAQALWRDAGSAGADAEFVQRLRSVFSEAQLVELVWAIGQFIGLGKMIAFLGLERSE